MKTTKTLFLIDSDAHESAKLLHKQINVFNRRIGLETLF